MKLITLLQAAALLLLAVYGAYASTQSDAPCALPHSEVVTCTL